jgi:hypothetical protein
MTPLRTSGRLGGAWLLILTFVVLVIAYALFGTGAGRYPLGIGLLIVGALQVSIGTQRLVQSAWRSSSWWQSHPALLHFATWHERRTPSRTSDIIAGAWQLLFGAVFFVAGVLVFAS